MTDFLYVDLDNTGLAWNLDETDPANPVLLVNGAKLPVSKDYMVIEKKGKTRTFPLPGLTVFAPTSDKAYVSERAVRILRRL
jgi:alkaline phosphatase